MKRFKQLMMEMKRYSHTGEGFVKPKPELWKGPHEGAEVKMMLAGVKPAALMLAHRKNEFEKHVRSGKLIVIKTHNDNYLVGRPEESKRLNILKNHLEKLHNNPVNKNILHAKIGILLGYHKDHIKKFLDQFKDKNG